MTAVFHGSPHRSDSNNPAVCRWINELLRLICKSNNGTRHCACVWECVWTPGRVSPGVWEPPWGGNWATFSPLSCVPPRVKKKREVGWLWTRCAIANTQEQIWGLWGEGRAGGRAAKIPRRGWVGAVATSPRSQTPWSGFSVQTHKHSHGVRTQTPKRRE